MGVRRERTKSQNIKRLDMVASGFQTTPFNHIETKKTQGEIIGMSKLIFKWFAFNLERDKTNK